MRRRRAQQQRERAAFRRRQRQPPYRHAVDVAATHFADGGADGAAAQRFLHRPQQIAAVCDADGEQALGREAEGVEPGSVGCAAFGERHVLGDPDDVPA